MFSNLPRLPTDNLYKLMAMTGLVTCLFAGATYTVATLRYWDMVDVVDMRIEHVKNMEPGLDTAVAAFKRIAETYTDSVTALTQATDMYAMKVRRREAWLRDSTHRDTAAQRAQRPFRPNATAG